jgi:hypothetical protein
MDDGASASWLVQNPLTQQRLEIRFLLINPLTSKRSEVSDSEKLTKNESSA